MWKTNWKETKERFAGWWNHEDLVLGMWGWPASTGAPHEEVGNPPPPKTIRDAHTECRLRAMRSHYELSRGAFPADILPVSDTHIGPGSLNLLFGSEPRFSEDTIWFEPCIHQCLEPEKLPPFVFDDANPWWRIMETTARECVNLARGKYMVGLPAFVENLDILSALRTPQVLMEDVLERPEWVAQKVREINQVWFEAYRRIYDIIKEEDGSSVYGPFRLWSSGKSAPVQCDASAMISPDMFDRFVLPSLTEQCEWLDNSMYHLDGTQAMCHLDSLLGIEALNAIEWTPQTGLERGGHPRWFPLYQRILNAGKSIQVVGVRKEDIVPLLDAVGGKGVYILTSFSSVAEVEEVMAMVEPYRPSPTRRTRVADGNRG